MVNVMKILSVIVAASVVVAPYSSYAQPDSPFQGMSTSLEMKQLERTLFWTKVGTATSVTILALSGLTAYKTATMCDDYPDPADDCGIVRGLYLAGTIVLAGVGATGTVAGVLGWVSTDRRLQTLRFQAQPIVTPMKSGAMVGLQVRY